ncbi:hypothetical protein D3C71_776280 [compost metagenome]
MQPTPAKSPTLKAVTPAPTSVTRPMISCPGTIGNVELPQSSRAWCRSEWQMPLYRIWMRTSPACTGRRSKENGTSGAVWSWTA